MTNSNVKRLENGNTAYHDVCSLRNEGHKYDPQFWDVWRLFQPVSWSIEALKRNSFCSQFCFSRIATCKMDVVVWRRANRLNHSPTCTSYHRVIQQLKDYTLHRVLLFKSIIITIFAFFSCSR